MICLFFSGLQAETHGRDAAIRCGRFGSETTARQPSGPVGGKPGTTALRAIPVEMLHGELTERRTTQPEG